MVDLVEKFETQAVALDYVFLYGAKTFLEYDLSNASISGGQVIVAMFPLIDNASEISNSHKLSRFDSNVTLWIGRKFDINSSTGTMSELDETGRQKYDRRLFELKNLVIAYIELLLCGNNYELRSFRMSEQINQFSENVDFISCDLTLRHENDT